MSYSIDVTIDKIFEKKNITDMKKPLATVHIALSSENQEPAFENTPMTWKLNLSNSRILGSIPTMAPLANLHHMKIADFLIYRTTGNEEKILYDPRDIHFLIEEFATQSFIGPPNYHFCGALDKAGGKGNQAPTRVSFYDYNRGDFYFTRVIEVVNSFTLRAFNPFTEMIIPRQIRYGYVVNNSSPMQIQFSSEHYMASGNTIKITDLQTDDLALNNAINGNTFTINSIPNDITIIINYSPSGAYISDVPLVTNYDTFNINVPLQLDYLYELAV
jgi:hypothetical protein